MTAERGRAAPLDGGEHTFLGRTQPVLDFERDSVLADDIGDVEAGPPGGCRAVAHPSSAGFAHSVERALRFRQHDRAHLSVSRRRPDAVVSE
jgi:hypothetical protein